MMELSPHCSVEKHHSSSICFLLTFDPSQFGRPSSLKPRWHTNYRKTALLESMQQERANQLQSKKKKKKKGMSIYTRPLREIIHQGNPLRLSLPEAGLARCPSSAALCGTLQLASRPPNTWAPQGT
ncbi:unnamed protein product [Boreogadus saida]